MIVGVGVDIENIERVSRLWHTHYDRVREAVFTVRELETGSLRERFLSRRQEQYLAARFAAKEAVIKMLGPPLDLPYELNDIEVLGDGVLSIHLRRGLKKYSNGRGLLRIQGTTCFKGPEVIATVIGEHDANV